MIRKALGALAVVLVSQLWLAPEPAAALDWSLFAGYWETADLGGSTGAGLRFELDLLPLVDFDVGASYYPSIEDAADLGVESRFETAVLPVDAGLRVSLGVGLGLHVGAGASLFVFDAEGPDPDQEFGWYGLVGFRLTRLFFEARYRQVEGTVDSLRVGELGVRESFDFDLGGFEVVAGIRF